MADDDSRLIDQFGNVIRSSDIARLREPIAAPGGFGGRPPFEGHRAFGIQPWQIGMYLRAADNGSTRDWFVLCEEIEELYPHYAAVLGKRKRQVCLLPVTVEEADDGPDKVKHADFVRKWLKTGVLDRAMFDMADAIGKGYSVNEIMWDTQPGRVWPSEIIWRHQRDFEISWKDGETIWLRDEAGFVPLAEHKFILHVHKSKSGGPARSGLTRMIAWMWMYAVFTMKDWALFVQGYGLPVRLGRYGPEASTSDKRTLWNAVRSIAGDLAAIIPKSMEMEFVQPQNANDGSKLFSERMNFLNYEVSKLVLGGTAGTDAVAGGHAVGQEHRAGEQDVEKFDAGLMAGSINRQLIPAMIAFTFGPQENGYPTIKIGEDEKVPVSDLIAAVADLGPLGYKVKASEMHDRMQTTMPEAGDEVIGAPPPAPAGAVGGKLDANGNPLVKADVTPKANPHPEINPMSDARALMTARSFRRFVAAQTAKDARTSGVIDALSTRLEEQAQGALAAMTAQIRACVEQAEDLPDLAVKLKTLNLDDTAFQNAMMQGMVLANLAGQADLLDEIAGQA
jgi:phage gp29-like protein